MLKCSLKVKLSTMYSQTQILSMIWKGCQTDGHKTEAEEARKFSGKPPCRFKSRVAFKHNRISKCLISGVCLYSWKSKSS